MAQGKPIYLAGWGHCSARGLTPAHAATSMLQGQTAPSWRTTAGTNYPYFRMPLPQSGWLARAEAALHLCTDEIRSSMPAAAWRNLPVFFASSSFQVGLHEHDATQPFPPAGGGFATCCTRWLGLDAAPWCFSNACTSSMSALEAACSLLAQGVIDHVLVLATELDNQLTANGFHSLGLLSPDACRPFAANRNGFVLGEAVAALWLTADAAHANNTGWRLASCASATDAHALTSPDPTGTPIANLIHTVLARAGLRAPDIGLVKLHAAGVGATDTAEAAALQQVFGRKPPPLLSLKPYVGHTLGASGLVELGALLACLEQGQIPATPGCDVPDAALGLKPVDKAQTLNPAHVLLLGVGFGGSVAAATISREPGA